METSVWSKLLQKGGSKSGAEVYKVVERPAVINGLDIVALTKRQDVEEGQGRRKRGRPQTLCMDVVKESMKSSQNKSFCKLLFSPQKSDSLNFIHS